MKRLLTFASSGPTARRAPRARLRGDQGSAMFEMAMLTPLMVMLLVGIIKTGTLFYNYITLADAVAVGARTLATSRGVSTACSSAETALDNAALNLNTSLITPTITFPSTNTHSDSCTTMYPGDTVELQATYPCDLSIPFLGNVWPSCTLTSETTVRIE